MKNGGIPQPGICMDRPLLWNRKWNMRRLGSSVRFWIFLWSGARDPAAQGLWFLMVRNAKPWSRQEMPARWNIRPKTAFIQECGIHKVSPWAGFGVRANKDPRHHDHVPLVKSWSADAKVWKKLLLFIYNSYLSHNFLVSKLKPRPVDLSPRLGKKNTTYRSVIYWA